MAELRETSMERRRENSAAYSGDALMDVLIEITNEAELEAKGMELQPHANINEPQKLAQSQDAVNQATNQMIEETGRLEIKTRSNINEHLYEPDVIEVEPYIPTQQPASQLLQHDLLMSDDTEMADDAAEAEKSDQDIFEEDEARRKIIHESDDSVFESPPQKREPSKVRIRKARKFVASSDDSPTKSPPKKLQKKCEDLKKKMKPDGFNPKTSAKNPTPLAMQLKITEEKLGTLKNKYASEIKEQEEFFKRRGTELEKEEKKTRETEGVAKALHFENTKMLRTAQDNKAQVFSDMSNAEVDVQAALHDCTEAEKKLASVHEEFDELKSEHTKYQKAVEEVTKECERTRKGLEAIQNEFAKHKAERKRLEQENKDKQKEKDDEFEMKTAILETAIADIKRQMEDEKDPPAAKRQLKFKKAQPERQKSPSPEHSPEPSSRAQQQTPPYSPSPEMPRSRQQQKKLEPNTRNASSSGSESDSSGSQESNRARSPQIWPETQDASDPYEYALSDSWKIKLQMLLKQSSLEMGKRKNMPKKQKADYYKLYLKHRKLMSEVRSNLKSFWKSKNASLKSGDEKLGELTDRELSEIISMHENSNMYRDSLEHVTIILGTFAQLREKMRDLKNAVEKGMEELEKRVPKTAAQMQNHDIGEFLQPKQVEAPAARNRTTKLALPKKVK